MIGAFKVEIINGTCDPSISVPVSNKAYPSSNDGVCIASIDFMNPNTVTVQGQAVSKGLPAGWRLVPYDEYTASIVSRLPWGADYIVMGQKAVATSTTSDPGKVLEHPSNALDSVQATGCNSASWKMLTQENICDYGASGPCYQFPCGSGCTGTCQYSASGSSPYATWYSKCKTECTVASGCQCQNSAFTKYAPSTVNARVLIQKVASTPKVYVKPVY